jgi:hypothetical protein
MAKLVCAKSGVVFQCEYMPLSLSSREITHPLFSVSKKKLLSLSGQWITGRLGPTESYLLYLSLLDSTELIKWRVPATFHSTTPQIIANNMESLVHIIGKIDVISHPSFALPSFAISPDTSSLENSYHWIQSWISNYNDWYDGLRDSNAREELKAKIQTREESLERLIKTSHTRVEDLATMLAAWAEMAGNFPIFQTIHPLSKAKIPLNEYWKQIIRACAREESIWKFPSSDLQELIEHCEDNIILGNIHSHSLMKLLRGGLKKQRDYLGFGDVELHGKQATQFTILSPNSSAEDANKIAAMASAPSQEPKPNDYPNKFAFMKAKANWDMKKRYEANGDKL